MSDQYPTDHWLRDGDRIFAVRDNEGTRPPRQINRWSVSMQADNGARGSTPEEREAAFSLMFAAPDLLGALEQATAFIGALNGGKETDTHHRGLMALAKAKGEAS